MKTIANIILHRQRLILISLFILSLSLRLFLTFNEFANKGTSGWVDAKYYLSIGQSFAEGDFYPKFDGDYSYMIVGPVLPLIIATSQILTHDPIIPVLILNCLLSALLVFVLFGLGKELVGTKSGYFMAIWSVVNIGIIRLNFQLFKEPIIFILLPLILLLLIKIYKHKNIIVNSCLSAFLFSVLIHTDERFVVFGPIFLLFIFLVCSKKDRYYSSLLWMLILVLSMIPWTIRNYIQHREIVILSPRMTTITSKFWGTDLVKLNYSSDKVIDRIIMHFDKKAKLAEAKYGISPRKYGIYERYYRDFLHFWKPTYFKLTYIHSGYEPVIWSFQHNVTSIVFYGIYIPFYLFGLIYSIIKKNYIIMFVGILPLYYSVFHALMLIWPLERYRLPLNFMIVLVAIWVVNELYLKYKERVHLIKTQLINSIQRRYNKLNLTS